VNSTKTVTDARLHHALGYLGLAPFVVGVATVLFGQTPAIRDLGLEALVAYAAVVASFIGAVHWGLWLAEYPDAHSSRLVWGVIPSLVSGALLLVSPAWALVGFVALYVLMAVVDLYALPMPHQGFRRLRRNLSLVVLICLLTVLPYAMGPAG